MRFHVTRHQAQRLSERRLLLEFVTTAVLHADRKQTLSRGRHGGILSKCFKSIGQRTLVVVTEIRGENCWLVTAYYED